MNISPKEFREKLLNKKHLPSGLVVKGNLNLWGFTSITHLPSGLVVNGYLDLYNCTSLTHLPSGLVVNGTLYCDKALIDSIHREDLPLYLNFNFEGEIHEYLVQRLR